MFECILVSKANQISITIKEYLAYLAYADKLLWLVFFCLPYCFIQLRTLFMLF